MNKLLIKAIAKSLQALIETLEDYSLAYSGSPVATPRNTDSLKAAFKLLREARVLLDGMLDQ